MKKQKIRISPGWSPANLSCGGHVLTNNLQQASVALDEFTGYSFEFSLTVTEVITAFALHVGATYLATQDQSLHSVSGWPKLITQITKRH